MPIDNQHLPLVQAAMQGDEPSFSQLYTLYYAKVYALALQTLKNTADAEDVLQATFVKAWQNLPGLSNPAAFNTWIQRITLNQCTDLLRRRKPQLSIDSDPDDEDAVPFALESDLMLPEAYAEQEDLSLRLRRLIMGLSDVQRQTITLFYFQGLSISEIAEVMDCNENTVKSRLYLARKTLKVEIEEEERKTGTKFYGVPLLPFGKIFVEQMWRSSLSPEKAAMLYSHIQGAIAAGAGAAAAATGAVGMSVVTKVLIGAIAAVVVAGAAIGGVTLLLKRNAPQHQPETTAATTVPAVTETASSAPASTAATTASAPDTAPAFRSYLELLQRNQAGIEAFNWDHGSSGHENASIGFPDLNNDGIPEMVYVYADSYRADASGAYNRGRAVLTVVSYADDAAKVVYTTDDPNGWYQNEAGGEMSYAVFTVNDDSALYYYTKGANEGSTRTFARIALDGSGNAAHTVLSTVNGNGNEALNDTESGIVSRIKTVYGRTSTVTYIDQMPEGAGMTYREAIAYLTGQLPATPVTAVTTPPAPTAPVTEAPVVTEPPATAVFSELAGKSLLAKGGGYGAAKLTLNGDGTYAFVHNSGNTPPVTDYGSFSGLERLGDVCYQCDVECPGTSLDGKNARIYTPDASLDDMSEDDAAQLVNHLMVGFGDREKAEEKLGDPIGKFVIVIDGFGIAFLENN